MRARRPPGDNTGHTKSAGKGPSWSHRSEVVWGAHSESVLESLGTWPGSAQHWQLSALLTEQQLMLVLCFHVSTETSCSFLMRPQRTQQDRQDGSHASAVGATTFWSPPPSRPSVVFSDRTFRAFFFPTSRCVSVWLVQKANNSRMSLIPRCSFQVQESNHSGLEGPT